MRKHRRKMVFLPKISREKEKMEKQDSYKENLRTVKGQLNRTEIGQSTNDGGKIEDIIKMRRKIMKRKSKIKNNE